MQFGLRLLMLVVALFATLFAWKNMLDERPRLEREFRRMNLENALNMAHHSRSLYVDYLDRVESSDPGVQLNGLEIYDKSIRKIKNEVEALKQ
jgi:hypothetical protein